MPRKPVPAGSGREPVPTLDPMTEEEWLAWCDATARRDEPPDLEQEPGAG